MVPRPCGNDEWNLATSRHDCGIAWDDCSHGIDLRLDGIRERVGDNEQTRRR